MSKNILIIGYGVVGHNLENELKDINPDIIDKYKPLYNTWKPITYDIGFICVDTPLKDNNTLDISEVENAIEEYDCKIYCIKSTCPVGTVEKLSKKYHKKIVFSPEYYGATKHCTNYYFDFTILGGEISACQSVIQAIIKCYDGRHKFYIVDSKTAELVKFMENSWIATKVSFCNQFYNVCKKENIAYEQLRELFLADLRVNPSHTFVYEETPFWNSHCLNKDVPAIATQYNMQLLLDVINFNEKQKRGEVDEV